MSRLVGFLAMAVIVYIGLQWIGQEVIQPLLAEINMTGATGSITGLAAFGIMGLLLVVVCFKS